MGSTSLIIKIVKNKDSMNIITDESLYYAKGISKVRRLKGNKYEYKANKEVSKMERRNIPKKTRKGYQQ